MESSEKSHMSNTSSDEQATKCKEDRPISSLKSHASGAIRQTLSRTVTRRSHQPSLHSTRSYIDGFSHYERQDETGIPTSGSSDSYLEVKWDGSCDPMNPKNLSDAKKWSVVIVLAFGALCVTSTSSIYTVTYEKMEAEFGNSRIVSTLGLALFVFGLGLAPMVLGPLSEFYGRRPIYIFGYVFFTIWLIPCATARNIQTILIARFLDGLSGSAFLSVAGGTVGDMFTRETLQAPMLIYTASPFIGPGLGPVWGGALNYFLDWRWSYYVLLIWSGVTTIFITAFVPETYAPVLLRKKAQIKRRETGDQRWKAPIEVMDRTVAGTVLRSLYRPFLLLCLDPMCFNLCLFSAILLGTLYLFFGAFNLVFSDVYGFNLWQVGLSFSGLSSGMLLGILSDPIWHYYYLHLLDKRERQTGQRTSEPEFRLPPSIVGAWFCVIGLFGFAWTIYARVHWIGPEIFTALYGFGVVTVFTGVFSFLVEAFPTYAASALSANSFARSSFAGAFPLFGVQMYRRLGYHWATTLLAFFTLIMAPFPYIFYLYGAKLRAKSRFGSV